MDTDTESWAWVVLGGSMLGNILCGMQKYLVGILHVELLDKYQKSNTTTAWVGALYISLQDIGGLLGSAMIGRYGCRVCCIVGSLLAFFGFVASAFAISITQLFFTYSLIAGLGLGLSYSSHLMAVGYYFQKLRSLAFGLASATGAVGILCGPLLVQALVNEFHIQGTFLLLGAISLNHSVSGMLYRPLTSGGRRHQHPSLEVQVDSDNDDGRSGLVSSLLLEAGFVERISEEETEIQMKDETTQDTATQHDSNTTEENSLQQGSLKQDTTAQQSTGHSREGLDHETAGCQKQNSCQHLSTVVNTTDITTSNHGNSREEEKMPFLGHENGNTSDMPIKESQADVSLTKETATRQRQYCTEVITPLISHKNVNLLENCSEESRSEAFQELSKLQEFRSRLSRNCTEESKTEVFPERSRPEEIHLILSEKSSENSRSEESLEPSHGKNQEGVPPSTETSAIARLWGGFRKVTANYRVVLSDPAFMLYCASLLFVNMHISGSYLHLPEYAQTLGTSPTMAAELFIAAGVGCLVSRVASGVMATDTAIDPVIVSVGMAGISGVITLLLPLYSASYTGQTIFALFLGLYTGGLVPLNNVLTIHFVGVAHQHRGFGIGLFFCGIGIITGPLVAALVVDYGGKYEHSFVILGFLMLMAAVLDLFAGVIFSRHCDHNDVGVIKEKT